MKPLRILGRDKRGIGAVEFALLAPAFIGMIFAATQLALVFFANAGIKNAVSEGARLATLFPRPSNEQIAARISQSRFGVEPAHLTGPTFTEGADNGAAFTEITMTYKAPISVIFFQLGPVTLKQTRRVYTQPGS